VEQRKLQLAPEAVGHLAKALSTSIPTDPPIHCLEQFTNQSLLPSLKS